MTLSEIEERETSKGDGECAAGEVIAAAVKGEGEMASSDNGLTTKEEESVEEAESVVVQEERGDATASKLGIGDIAETAIEEEEEEGEGERATGEGVAADTVEEAASVEEEEVEAEEEGAGVEVDGAGVGSVGAKTDGAGVDTVAEEEGAGVEVGRGLAIDFFCGFG